MTATDQKFHYQVTDHGAGRISVQCFGGEKPLDESLIRDVDGWRQIGSQVFFRTPEELAAVIFCEYAGMTIGAGEWPMIEESFRDRT